MSSGSLHAMYLVAEANYGVTPDTPALKRVRHVSTNLGLTKNTFESEELRSDRQLTDVRDGTRQAGGDIVGEMSYGTYDDILQALLGGTWAEAGAAGADADVLKAGSIRRSFTVVRNFGDLATGKPFLLYTGVEFNTMKLSVGLEGAAKVTFGAVGKDMVAAAAAPTGATYPAATTSSPMDAFDGTIQEGGATIATVTELELTLENGIEPRFTLGNGRTATVRPSIGKSRVTGQLTAVFDDSSLLEKFINGTASSLQFVLGDGTDTLTFNIPKLKYTGGQPDVGGEGTIVLTMPFTAYFSPTDATQISITR